MKFQFRFFIWLLALGFSTLANGQDSVALQTDTMVITMNDGSQRIGVIVSDDGREVLLKTTLLGNIYIQKSNIKSIKKAEPESLRTYNGEYGIDGPFTTRYYFTTNALPIKKHDDYAMIHLYGPEVHFAIGDHFTAGIMTTWIASPFVLALKYSIPSRIKNLHVGLGTLVGSSAYINSFKGYGGLHWGMITLGDRSTNITLSAGYSYFANGDNSTVTGVVPGVYKPIDAWGNYSFEYAEYKKSNITAPVIGIGGIAKVTKTASFILDGMALFTKKKVGNSSQVKYVNEGSINEMAIVTRNKSKTTVLYLMPGMRFQNTDNRAFQIALAGLLFYHNDNVRTFPVPTFSWFFKF